MPEVVDDKLGFSISRALKAQELLDNPLLVDSFDRLRDAYIAQWKITNFKDTEGRERLWQAVNCIEKMRENFRLMVEDGKIAKRQLEDMQGLNQPR